MSEAELKKVSSRQQLREQPPSSRASVKMQARIHEESERSSPMRQEILIEEKENDPSNKAPQQQSANFDL